MFTVLMLPDISCYSTHLIALHLQLYIDNNHLQLQLIKLMLGPKINIKYTNPARGIIDFCKQKLWPPPMQPTNH